MGKIKYLGCIAIALLAFCRPGSAQDLAMNSPSGINHSASFDNESLLIKALDEVRRNKIKAALSDLEYLVNVNPKFRLAQLVYADLLLSRSRPITDFGNLSSAPYHRIMALRAEAIARWQHHLSTNYNNKVPASLVKLNKQQDYAIIVDLKIPRLYLFKNVNGHPKLVKDFYVSIGKKGFGKLEEGDQKTPIGVYFASSYINPAKLPDFYGDGAFPINYPNAWDRKNGYTGYGIWLHGTPSNTYSRPPRDSDGCIIVSNQDLKSLENYIKTGTTPVILAKDIDWISVNEWKKRQKKFSRFLEQWKKDWESRNTDLYLSHYSKDYSGMGKDYEDWVDYKRRVNSVKKYIEVDIRGTSMFEYPDGMNILVVTFEQDYKSDSVKRRFKKRQYWRMDKDGKWRIFYEGSVS